MLYYLFLLGIEDSADKCPITTPPETCHMGLPHMCNHDVDCMNGTLCCFNGCRRKCWDSFGSRVYSKRTNILLQPKLNIYILLSFGKTYHYRHNQSV